MEDPDPGVDAGVSLDGTSQVLEALIPPELAGGLPSDVVSQLMLAVEECQPLFAHDYDVERQASKEFKSLVHMDRPN